MSERAGAFVGGVILAVALVSCVLVKLTPAAPRQLVLDPKKAMVATVPLFIDDQGRAVGRFIHECCACGSTHTVGITLTNKGVEMFWWTDEVATRKARIRRGIVERNPWAAESDYDPWSSPDR